MAIAIRKLKSSDGWRLWLRSWEFSKQHWILLFVAGLIGTLISLAVTLIPVLGGTLGPIIFNLFGFGYYSIGEEMRKMGKFNFETLFSGFEIETLVKLAPILFILSGVGVFQEAISYQLRSIPYGIATASGISLCLGLLIMSFLVFAPPLIIWEKQSFKQAVNCTIEAVTKNIWALCVYSIVPMGIFVLPSLIVIFSAFTGNSSHVVIGGQAAGVVLFMTLILFAPAIVVSLYLLYEAIFETKTVT